MFFVNPYKTIFHENNWFFNQETKKITYSDSSVTLDKVYLHVPFKDNPEFNRRILVFFRKFMSILENKILEKNDKSIKVNYYANLNCNAKKPVVLLLKPLIYTDNWIKIYWELIPDNANTNSTSTSALSKSC